MISVSRKHKDVIYVTSNLRGLKIFDISEVIPKEISSLGFEGTAWDQRISKDENELFIAST